MFRVHAFIKRGFLMTVSYKTSFALGLLSLFLNVAQMAFLAVFLSGGNSLPQLEQYGGNLLNYLVSGTIFMSVVSWAISSYQSTIQSEQQMGTLPYLLCSPGSVIGVLFLSSLWTIIWTLFTSSLGLFLTATLFQARLEVNLTATLLVLVLTIVTLGGIGLASGGIILVTKQGDPISWIFTTVASFTSGVVFPLDILPAWLQTVGQMMPTTYAMRALRKALLVGADLAEIWPDIRILLLMALVTVPLGLLVFHLGYHRSRVEGSLFEY